MLHTDSQNLTQRNTDRQLLYLVPQSDSMK